MSEDNNEAKISIGNISNNSGKVNVAGRDIHDEQNSTGLSEAEIKRLFKQIYTDIAAHPRASATQKEDLKAEMEDIQAKVTETVQKNDQIDESFFARRFRNIARIAPDVLDVVVATLANPLAGLGVAVKKIAEKAKADQA